jgi:hypothetical protein
MEVSPYLLRRTGSALRDLASELCTTLTREREGPDDPAWAADLALHAQSAAWDGYLTELAGRLADSGDCLIRAADRYAAADGRAASRLTHRPC